MTIPLLRKLAVTLAALLLIASAVAQTATPPANHTEPDAGTAGNPYLLETLENLYWIPRTIPGGINTINLQPISMRRPQESGTTVVGGHRLETQPKGLPAPLTGMAIL
jgi:hypothetical protein